MKSLTVSAPGKLHLLGEHSVVYGKPAIIAAVDKRCSVTITEREDEKVVIKVNPPLPPSKGGEAVFLSPPAEGTKGRVLKQEISIPAILNKTQQAQKTWEAFSKTNDTQLLTSITPQPIDYVMICLGEALHHLHQKISAGFDITITSDIPIGSGMGSSSALAVAIAGALCLFIDKKLDKEKINHIAFLAEQKKHGTPSGGDNAASCYGGLIWYQKKSRVAGQMADEKIIRQLPFSFSKTLAEKFFIINTGIPEESTGEMVSSVKDFYSKEQSVVQHILDDQEQLVHELSSAIETSDDKKLIEIIRQGENNLEKLGMVSESTKKLIRAIENADGAAKICGGGGRKDTSGIVLAFHENPDTIITISKEYNLSCSKIKLGEEGVREEK
jgi:mevalonate kinase